MPVMMPEPVRTRYFRGGLLPFLAILILNLAFWGFAGAGSAQTQTGPSQWSQPLNLSRSGAASKPVLVVDASGVFHLIWKDEFAGVLYSTGDGTQWSEPAQVVLPSGLAVPTLLADQNGYIHAFWTVEDNTFFYSRVQASRFAIQQAWSNRQQLAASALDFDVVEDSTGRLHLGYIRPLETETNPAGVYYTWLEAGALSWNPPAPLFTSPYFRGLARENAHIELDTAGLPEGEQIYVAWDNRPRDAAQLIRSQDGGASWGEVIDLDAGLEASGAIRPSHVELYISPKEKFLIWQSGDPAAGCTQYYQQSSGSGETWTEPRPVFAQMLGCPTATEILAGQGGRIYILNEIQEQVYLQAWDGERWSDPQLQSELTSFIDPETGGQIHLSCRQALLVGSSDLFVTGCDQGAGKDIWLLRRSLSDAGGWFSAETGWNPPVQVGSGERLRSLEVVAEREGLFHVFWSEAGRAVPDSPATELYYARFEGGRWSEPVEILASARGKIEQPAAVLDAQGRLLLAWSGGQSGEITFSSVEAVSAALPSEWARPVRLPSPSLSGSSPDILSAPNGTIYVVYAVPLNEFRGIYLTRSTDGGLTWAEPQRVIDAQAAGWSMVDKPRLALGENGSLHVLWSQYSLPGGVGPLAMYYARSDDGGLSWSNPATVSDNPVYWSQMVNLGEYGLHRLWQELSDVRTTLWHETSRDNGVTWERTAPVSIFGDALGQPGLAWDRDGRLHLLQMVRSGPDAFLSQHWVWDGERWEAETGLNIQIPGLNEVGQVMVDMSADGDLALIFKGRLVEAETGLLQDNLYFADRLLPVANTASPAGQSPPLVETGGTPQPGPDTGVSEGGSQPRVRSTATLPPGLENFEGRDERSDAWLGSLLGPVAAGLIIFGLIFVGMLLRRVRGV